MTGFEDEFSFYLGANLSEARIYSGMFNCKFDFPMVTLGTSQFSIRISFDSIGGIFQRPFGIFRPHVVNHFLFLVRFVRWRKPSGTVFIPIRSLCSISVSPAITAAFIQDVIIKSFTDSEDRTTHRSVSQVNFSQADLSNA